MPLCLTRKVGDTVRLELPDGSIILIEVGDVQGKQVRLIFNADEAVKIHRGEVGDEPV